MARSLELKIVLRCWLIKFALWRAFFSVAYDAEPLFTYTDRDKQFQHLLYDSLEVWKSYFLKSSIKIQFEEGENKDRSIPTAVPVVLFQNLETAERLSISSDMSFVPKSEDRWQNSLCRSFSGLVYFFASGLTFFNVASVGNTRITCLEFPLRIKPARTWKL